VITGYCGNLEDLKDKTSFDTGAYNTINTLFSSSSYNPEDYLTSKYISSGDVELGYNNIASGPNNKLGGFSAGSFGNGNELFDGFPTAFGRGNKVHGFASSAIGQNNKVIGEKSIAIGANNTITAAFSFVSGNNNKARGYNGFIPGSGTGNTSLHAGFTVGGNSNTIDLRSSDRVAYPSNTVFGYNLLSYTPGQTVFGRYNKKSDSVFIIGNGTSTGTSIIRKNIFEITKNGAIKVPVFTAADSDTQLGEYALLRVYKDTSGNYNISIEKSS
jgi:hypothetical protein